MVVLHSLVVGCSLMHIFCCGIPLLVSLVSLGTSMGIASSSAFEFPIFEEFEAVETEVLIFSGIILAISILLKLLPQKNECCEKKKLKFCKFSDLTNDVFIKTSVLLYSFSLIVTFFGEASH